MEDAAVETFWNLARFHANVNAAPSYFGPTTLEVITPPAWAFGVSTEQADTLLGLVLAGTKTATSSALWDYEDQDETLPQVGSLSILLDGSRHPHALIATTAVRVVRFEEVDEEHARLEGEGDLSLPHWRRVHRQLFTETATGGRDFTVDLPVVLERFEVIYRA